MPLEGTQGPRARCWRVCPAPCMSVRPANSLPRRGSLWCGPRKGSNEDDLKRLRARVADYLFEPLAEDGRPDLILLLFVGHFVQPLDNSLASENYTPGPAGKTAGGVQLLFDAYDSASPSRRASIERADSARTRLLFARNGVFGTASGCLGNDRGTR